MSSYYIEPIYGQVFRATDAERNALNNMLATLPSLKLHYPKYGSPQLAYCSNIVLQLQHEGHPISAICRDHVKRLPYIRMSFLPLLKLAQGCSIDSWKEYRMEANVKKAIANMHGYASLVEQLAQATIKEEES